jgi:hypothetical protein
LTTACQSMTCQMPLIEVDHHTGNRRAGAADRGRANTRTLTALTRKPGRLLRGSIQVTIAGRSIRFSELRSRPGRNPRSGLRLASRRGTCLSPEFRDGQYLRAADNRGSASLPRSAPRGVRCARRASAGPARRPESCLEKLRKSAPAAGRWSCGRIRKSCRARP